MCDKHIKFINLIGGVTKIAKLCGITKGAVWQWKKNGIPKAQMNFLKIKYPDEYCQIYMDIDTEQPDE